MVGSFSYPSGSCERCNTPTNAAVSTSAAHSASAPGPLARRRCCAAYDAVSVRSCVKKDGGSRGCTRRLVSVVAAAAAKSN